MNFKAIGIIIASLVLASIAVFYLHSKEESDPKVKFIRENADLAPFNAGAYRIIPVKINLDSGRLEYEYESFYGSLDELFSAIDLEAKKKGWQTAESAPHVRTFKKTVEYKNLKTEATVTLAYSKPDGKVRIVAEYGG